MIQSPISGRLSLAEQELKCGEIQNATISKLVHMSELGVEDGVKLNLGVFAEIDQVVLALLPRRAHLHRSRPAGVRAARVLDCDAGRGRHAQGHHYQAARRSPGDHEKRGDPGAPRGHRRRGFRQQQPAGKRGLHANAVNQVGQGDW